MKNDIVMPSASNAIRKSGFVTLFIAALSLLSACGMRQQPRPIVTVSIPPQKFFLEQIVGNLYDVRSLLSAGGDPESYDPSFTNLMNVRNSVAFLKIGNIGFENAIVDKIHNENPSLPIFDTSEGISLITGTHGGGDPDPHVWTSVPNARIIAANMARVMSDVDPEHRAVFESNLKRFDARLDSLDVACRKALAPVAGLPFLVWHPSMSYFARDYSLRQIALGGSEHKEVSIPSLRKRIAEARASGARILFVQKDTDSRQTESANVQIGAREVEVNPLDYDWMGQMGVVVKALSEQ